MTTGAPPANGSLLQIVGSRPSLAKFASGEPLWREAGSPTQSLAWLDAAAASFHDEALHIVTLHDGQVAAVAPLVEAAGAFETASVRRIYEPVDLLWRDEDALEALAEMLSRYRLPLILRRLPRDSPSIEALRRAYNKGTLVVERPAGRRRLSTSTRPGRSRSRASAPGGAPIFGAR